MGSKKFSENIMIVIAYSDGPGYLFMVNRLKKIIESWNIPFKAYDRQHVEKLTYYETNASFRKVMSYTKGGGYWAWKPLIMLNALLFSDEVIYLDSSVVPKNPEILHRLMNFTSKITALRTIYSNKDWTKRSCFVNMKCDNFRYWDAHQVWAGVVAVRNHRRLSGIKILQEWLNYCSDEDTVTDSKCEGNFPTFVQHRHDQSILTNLLIKRKQSSCNDFYNSEFLDDVKYA
jgi:hypothetical protein